MYIEDFRRLLAAIGCHDYRVMSNRQITIDNPQLQTLLEPASFYSITIRAFKLFLEDLCEDYGQIATYLGGIAPSPNTFTLDDHHTFEKNRPMLVCGNTADMLQQTRYSRYFKIDGDKSTHFGLFDCKSPTITPSDHTAAPGGCC